jgi:protein-L-isoaspartate(D-aspartate) O-methyltransferase
MSDFQTRRTMMVDTQVRPSDVTKFPIIGAMLSVPREAYVPQSQRQAAYASDNLEVGAGRWLLEPRTFAKMLDALSIQAGDLVLDIGCGLGYSSAVLADMAEAVIAVEIEELANEAQTILAEQSVDNVAVIAGDLAAGAAKHGPYDAIIVQTGMEVIPTALTDQLRDCGRIAVLVMTGALGEVRIGHKDNGRVSWKYAFNATVPVDAEFKKTAEFQL